MPLRAPSPSMLSNISTILYIVRSNIISALLDINPHAERLQQVKYPFGDIFGSRVKRKHFVEVVMIQWFFHKSFDFAEVHEHPILVERLALQMDRDEPVMSMHSGALAFVIKCQ